MPSFLDKFLSPKGPEGNRVVYANNGPKNMHYSNNEVTNTKYTLLNFIPKNLMEQFRYVPNISIAEKLQRIYANPFFLLQNGGTPFLDRIICTPAPINATPRRSNDGYTGIHGPLHSIPSAYLRLCILSSYISFLSLLIFYF